MMKMSRTRFWVKSMKNQTFATRSTNFSMMKYVLQGQAWLEWGSI